jgi:hypothetical protein
MLTVLRCELISVVLALTATSTHAEDGVEHPARSALNSVLHSWLATGPGFWAVH